MSQIKGIKAATLETTRLSKLSNSPKDLVEGV